MFPTRMMKRAFMCLTGTVVLLSLAYLYCFTHSTTATPNTHKLVFMDHALSQTLPLHSSSVIVKEPPSTSNSRHDQPYQFKFPRRQLSPQVAPTTTRAIIDVTQISLNKHGEKKTVTTGQQGTQDSTITAPRPDDTVRIVYMPGIWLSAPEIGFKTQKCNVHCLYTRNSNVSTLENVDAAVFHLPTSSTDPNDILRDAGLKDTSKIFKVALSMESARNYPKQFHYISKYDVEMSYRMNSDVPNPYFTFARGKQDLLEKTNSTWEMREKAVLYVARNCRTQSNRDKLVKMLREYVRVDSVSVCEKNMDWPKDIPRDNKRALLRRYVAFLAAENSIEKDYVSEKVYAGLITGAVPIYFGAPNINSFVPSNSVIKVPYPIQSNLTVTELANNIKFVLSSKDEYERLTHFKRQTQYEDKFLETFNFTRVDVTCRLCRKIFSLKHGLTWDHKRQDFRRPSN